VTQGLSGAAVATGWAVVVNDVTADPRYLTAFASTLSEAIVPVVDPGTDTVVGTLDVENAERDAFTDADRQALVGCAAALWGCLQQRGHSRSTMSQSAVRADIPAVLGPRLADQTVDDRDHAG
jgi:L-methionine (R)-S-oxide reductase